jgi:hypothetical protein
VVCGKVRVRNTDEAAAPGAIEESERTSMDDKLEAMGRCDRCGLLNPHECVSGRAEYYLRQREDAA